MNASPPHYVLLSQTARRGEPGRWRFTLRAADGSTQLVADDVEPDVEGERLELLAVVRGLEALEQPSRVTLLTPSSYVRRGIRCGLNEWQRSDWRWEYFGHMVPVRDHDLWRRVERAMRFHQLECRRWRLDPPHNALPAGRIADAPQLSRKTPTHSGYLSGRHRLRRLVARCRSLAGWWGGRARQGPWHVWRKLGNLLNGRRGVAEQTAASDLIRIARQGGVCAHDGGA